MCVHFSRRPAWTDRILYQVHVDAYDNVKLGVEQTSYSALHFYTQSDHKPVTSHYTIKVRDWIVLSLQQVNVSDWSRFSMSLDAIWVFVLLFLSSHYNSAIILQVFANHEERCVRFQAVGTWLVGEGGQFNLILDSDVTTSPWDYISIYKVRTVCCTKGHKNIRKVSQVFGDREVKIYVILSQNYSLSTGC